MTPRRRPLAVRAYGRLLRLLHPVLQGDYRADAEDTLLDHYRTVRADAGAGAAAWLFVRSVWLLLASAVARDRRAPQAGARGGHLSRLRHDVRYGLKSIRKQPGFAFTATVILAVGIGATVTIFSVVDHVVLRQMPYPDAGRLVHFANGGHAYPSFRVWRTLGSFEAVVAAEADEVVLAGDREPERLSVAAVSEDFFRTLGAAPHLGHASLRTGERTLLGLTGRDVRYVSETGHLVYAVENALFAVAFDVDRVRVVGGAAAMLQDVDSGPGLTGATRFALSDTGTLVYVSSGSQSARTLAWVDRTGSPEPLRADPRPYRYPRLSPDGTRVALAMGEDRSDVWIWDLARELLQNVTTSEATEQYALWTPAGDRLIFSSDRDGPRRLYWIAADGSGNAEPLTEGGAGLAQEPVAVSPDGSQLIFRVDRSTTSRQDLRVVSLDAGHVVQDILATPFRELNAEISPDGDWIAYQSDRSGQMEVYISPFPDVESSRTAVAPGRYPAWAPGGRELFYVVGEAPTEGRMMSVAVDTDPALTVGAPVALFDVTNYYFGTGRSYDVDPNGQRFLTISRGADPAQARERIIEVVLNWFEELKARVPVR